MAKRPHYDMTDEDERYEVIGVTSFGHKCGKVGYPGQQKQGSSEIERERTVVVIGTKLIYFMKTFSHFFSCLSFQFPITIL